MKKRIALLLTIILVFANSVIALATEISEDESENQDNSLIGEADVTTIEMSENSTNEKDIDAERDIQEKTSASETEKLENNEETLEVYSAAYPIVEFVPTNSEGQAKPLIDEDSKVVMEAIGAEWSMDAGEAGVSGGSGDLISPSSAFSVDWSKSTLQMEDIWGSDVIGYWFERDSSDKLVLKNYYGGSMRRVKGIDGNEYIGGSDDYEGWNFFEPAATGYVYKEYYTPDFGGNIPDLIEIKAWHSPTSFNEYGEVTEASWTGKSFIVNKEKSVFRFKESSNEGELRIIPEVTDNIYTIGSGNGATITCTGELKDFISVSVDGNEIDRNNYTLAEGSTILTFTSKYLDTLSVGEHNVTLKYTYGSIDTKLTILDNKGIAATTGGTGNNKTIISSSPRAAQTGDSNAIFLYVLTGLLSAGVCTVMLRKRYVR